MNKKYAQLLDEGWQHGSSNTFVDLGLENAEELQAKAYLRAVILSRIADLKITQVEAARLDRWFLSRRSNLMSETTPKGSSSDTA
jgi:predicted XRE-type DNA-binding protein